MNLVWLLFILLYAVSAQNNHDIDDYYDYDFKNPDYLYHYANEEGNDTIIAQDIAAEAETTTIPAEADTTTIPAVTTDPPATTIEPTTPPPVTTVPPTTTTTTTTAAPTTTTQPTTTTTTQKPPDHHDITQTSLTWTPGTSDSVMVTVDQGYSIAVTIDCVDINGDTQDYLVIKGGNALDDGSTSGRIFTYSVGKKMKYLYFSNTVFGYYHHLDTNTDGKFTITFQKIEQPSTTTEQPTTTTTEWPTANPSDSIHMTVYIDKKAVEDAKLNDVFQNAVYQMAIDYCSENKVKLLEPITKSNVLIINAQQCPINWPGSKTCVKIKFRVPIVYEEPTEDPTTWTGYQLKTAKLQVMWNKYSRKYLQPNLAIFEEPEINKIITWWAIAIAVVIVVFVALLGVLRFLSTRFSAVIRRRRLSDTFSIISERKDSRISLGPHYLQVTPKFFENEYPMVDSELQ